MNGSTGRVAAGAASVSDEELGAAFRRIVLYWPALVERMKRVYGVLQVAGDKRGICPSLALAIDALDQELDNAGRD